VPYRGNALRKFFPLNQGGVVLSLAHVARKFDELSTNEVSSFDVSARIE
jgi:hypothetical protein